MNDKVGPGCIDEKAEMRAQIQELSARCAMLKDELGKSEAIAEKAQKENEELLKKIENLKGQIDAYQYCMNCRRL